ncbi:MAG: hypothetical protein MJ249_03575 [Kiritimatiellae bacterium]|nr:hypothetical protein [Kiritimatiellia bacterium]
MAQWFFSEKGVNDKERDPGWDEYFSSNRSTVESLVRESIQNSLDAATKKRGPGAQALVRITYSGAKNALSEAVYDEYLSGATEHYAAKDCGLSAASGKCPYFVIEDFNTDGLAGDIIAENEDEPYFKFLKCENKSTKNEEGASTLGKWGIGKVVFPIASRLRTFFAYSIRSGSSVDATHPREILVGECLLRYHTVDGTRYTPDGWWGGERDAAGRNRPATGEQNASDIATFKSRFGLTRKDEPGLSVVVPYVEDISVDELKRSIVENYMVALVSGALRVEFKVGDGPFSVYDAEHAIDILDFLEKLSTEEGADDDTKRSAEMFKMILDAYTVSDDKIRHVKCHAGYAPDWQDGQFEGEVVKAIRADLEADERGEGAISVVEVPIVINKKGASEWPEATFRVILRRTSSPHLQVRPRFYRNGLYISHVGANRVSGYMAFVILDGAVAAMMNEAEPPSHTQWFANTGVFSKIYNNADKIISYIKLSPRRIVHYIDAAEDDDDYEALKGYFSISRKQLKALPKKQGRGKSKGAGGGGKGGGAGKGGRPNGGSGLPAVPPKPYILEKYTDSESGCSCFRIIAKPDTFRGFMFTADLSYVTISGKNVYDKNDFSLLRGGGIRVFAEGVAETRFPAPNRIEALIGDDGRDFVIDVKGFDPNRDLEVDDHYRDPAKWNEAEVQNG